MKKRIKDKYRILIEWGINDKLQGSWTIGVENDPEKVVTIITSKTGVGKWTENLLFWNIAKGWSSEN